MGRDEEMRDNVRQDNVHHDGTRPVHHNEYNDEKTGHIDTAGLEASNEHHYETKVPQIHGVSELPLYPRERVDNGDGSLKEELAEAEVLDLYKPFPIDPNIPHEEHILTVRALVVGLILGSLVNCSNVYLGMFNRELIKRKSKS